MAAVSGVRTFSPGHITGFFEICDKPASLLKKGSRGAGICTSLGVETEVAIKQGSGLETYIDGRRADAPVTRTALEFLMRRKWCKFIEEHRVVVRTKLQLPMSQGFGMSAAGALGASLGLAVLLRIPDGYRNSVAAAHCAEATCRTGLGDVAGLLAGGFEMRLKPGLPPFGVVKSIPFKKLQKMVVAVLGGRISTKDILTDPKSRRRIISAGKKCMDEFSDKPSLENLFRLSNRFSAETGLATDELLEAIKSCRKYGMAAQSMLGNSVFAVGKTGKITDILGSYGKLWTCWIDEEGPRIIA